LPPFGSAPLRFTNFSNLATHCLFPNLVVVIEDQLPVSHKWVPRGRMVSAYARAGTGGTGDFCDGVGGIGAVSAEECEASRREIKK